MKRRLCGREIWSILGLLALFLAVGCGGMQQQATTQPAEAGRLRSTVSSVVGDVTVVLTNVNDPNTYYVTSRRTTGAGSPTARSTSVRAGRQRRFASTQTSAPPLLLPSAELSKRTAVLLLVNSQQPTLTRKRTRGTAANVGKSKTQERGGHAVSA